MQPLEGLRILDLTTVVMGPYATSLLGDMGADVIKLEAPGGDIVRNAGPSRHGTMGGMFMHANASKRSIVVDLKKPEGREVALRLAAGCDVLVYNLRPRAMVRLGLDYEDVRKVNPALLYVGTFGFGQDGPYADRPAYDDLIQAAAALPMLLAESSGQEPHYVPVNIADRIVGLHTVNVILAGLRHRDATGRGQRIDVPMFETMASFVLGDHLGGLSFVPPLDEGGYARILSRFRKPFRTLDGYLCAVIYTDTHWRRFFELIGHAAKFEKPIFRDYSSRLKNIDEVYQSVEAIFPSKTTAEWQALLRKADIPNMVLHTLKDILDDEHLRAVGFFEKTSHPSEGAVLSMKVPSQWSESQPKRTRLAPVLGEHTREILSEAGYNEAAIDGLLARESVFAG